jgi:hypothetical protein
MTVEQAFKELIGNGFSIDQVETDKFMVFDNGKFGFCSDEDPFIVDGDGILEIHENVFRGLRSISSFSYITV